MFSCWLALRGLWHGLRGGDGARSADHRHTGGATVDTVPATAGVLVEPGNVKALTRALRMVIENEEERRRLARGALAAAADLPTWGSTARIFASALERLR